MERMEEKPALPDLGVSHQGELASIASAGISLLPSITSVSSGLPDHGPGSSAGGGKLNDESAGRTLIELKEKASMTRPGEHILLREHELSPGTVSPHQKLAAIYPQSPSTSATSPQRSKVNLPGIDELVKGAQNGSLGHFANGSASQSNPPSFAQSSRPLRDRADYCSSQPGRFDQRSPTAYTRPSPQDTAYHGNNATSPSAPSGIHTARGVYYSKRRSSRGSEHAPTYQTSPSTNGYSTNDHLSSSVGSTPSDQKMDVESPYQSTHTNSATVQDAGRRTSYSGSFKCDDPECRAPPFATQYLLNSHKNVHSSDRPHFCPEPGCNRSKSGRGFKRKNEMIRHGLVHNSPGYVCPFCPDQKHRYPRPDNLQRHVKAHHKEKKRDDPSLQDVLAQRPQGGHRGRRRRMGG